ncbi:mRpL32 [Drosophila busckii]|uniref:Large ribosomal subunit protein bL32m n=1 Tax=Drosophila busckii TaxID=30019 RepID=A0A0M4ET00_DROBS|nr:39S ribosomal protein L32, mitochondrial [Drosophila busckii]ALC47960.1 mRpL32 [Drosophila busckii]
MSRNLFLSITNFIKHLETLFVSHCAHTPALAHASIQHNNHDSLKFRLKDLVDDGILWAVPKHRRSVEKRLKRKFGYLEYVWKPLRIKANLRSCQHCGHNHELGLLCPHCYEKVRQETQLMQEKIQEQLSLEPTEQDVVVLYEGEKSTQTADELKGKRIVEMKKPRPMWFTKNLLQKSTQQLSEAREVKPSDLG